MADYTKVTGVAAANIVKITGVAAASVVKRDGVSPAATSFDWTESLWMDDNLTSDQGDWNDSYHTSVREFKNGSYTRNCVPFLDDSGATKYLKVAFIGDQDTVPNDFISMGSYGTRVQVNGGTSPDMCAISDTGVAFAGDGNLTDGDHAIQMQFRHDTAKTDTYHNATIVLSCSSNTLSCYIRYLSTTSSTASFYSIADTKASPTATKWSCSYNPSTNVWTHITQGNNFWWGAYPGSQLTIGADSSGNGYEKKNTDWYVDSDTNEHRMWYFKTG